MKKIMLLLVAVSAIAISAFVKKPNEEKTSIEKALELPSTDPITSAQRTYGMDELKRTKALLEKQLNGLTTKQLNFKPGKDKWSIAEITEHIALAETGIMQIIDGTLKAPADPSKRKEIKVTDQEIAKRLTNRSFKAQSPEIIKPTGKFPSTDEALKAFIARRDATITYIEKTDDDLLNHFWQHPATGTIDLYQSILLISAHAERHILQIIEVKDSDNFPK